MSTYCIRMMTSGDSDCVTSQVSISRSHQTEKEDDIKMESLKDSGIAASANHGSNVLSSHWEEGDMYEEHTTCRVRRTNETEKSNKQANKQSALQRTQPRSPCYINKIDNSTENGACGHGAQRLGKHAHRACPQHWVLEAHTPPWSNHRNL